MDEGKEKHQAGEEKTNSYTSKSVIRWHEKSDKTLVLLTDDDAIARALRQDGGSVRGHDKGSSRGAWGCVFSKTPWIGGKSNGEEGGGREEEEVVELVRPRESNLARNAAHYKPFGMSRPITGRNGTGKGWVR